MEAHKMAARRVQSVAVGVTVPGIISDAEGLQKG